MNDIWYPFALKTETIKIDAFIKYIRTLVNFDVCYNDHIRVGEDYIKGCWVSKYEK